MRNGTLYRGESSSSTSLSRQQDTEDDLMIATVLSKEYAKTNGPVSARLHNLASIPVRIQFSPIDQIIQQSFLIFGPIFLILRPFIVLVVVLISGFRTTFKFWLEKLYSYSCNLMT